MGSTIGQYESTATTGNCVKQRQAGYVSEGVGTKEWIIHLGLSREGGRRWLRESQEKLVKREFDQSHQLHTEDGSVQRTGYGLC